MSTQKKKSKTTAAKFDPQDVLQISNAVNSRRNQNGTVMLLKTDESGLFYKLDGVAAEAWITLEKPTAGAELLDVFSKLYPKHQKEIEKDIPKLLAELLAEELIFVSEAKSSRASAAPKQPRAAGYSFGELKKFNLEEIETEVLNESIYLDVFAGSDLKLKQDIEPIQGALGKVMQLDGINYRWNSKQVPRTLKVNTKARHAGLIAQQVATVMPELVRVDKKTGHAAVEYSKMSSYLVEAIKELNETILAQEKRIKKLEQARTKKNG